LDRVWLLLFLHHDVHQFMQISAFIRECFMARALGVDPLKLEVEFDACEPESFLSFGLAGSKLACF
jgi:hypothetical protein